MFTPSAQFNERWLTSPDAMKDVIYDELNDIIALLKGNTPATAFHFATPDVAKVLHHLQTAHLQTLKQLTQKMREEKVHALLPTLDQAIDDKLTQQLSTLSDDLKQWLRQMVQDELAKASHDNIT